ncbi:MAG: RagB/SusD family nutrient uptake outer membrane protein [Ferruginibacter sp.]|uniref:RagB/SusD family nutrient uptake outer membrane protein n=1 Tax=Ferruginibacter sp. TaxID=1940288 RepID=UPI00265AF271|nr:RagB/SusD family nutrient uptake outer membrane protein [Ferruginibacter sp.]MDB5277095.1 RagB/SusD family nutrient uptake outer membrane protein [Ferruginibacter sp.]
MKKTIKTILIPLCAVILVTSCNKDFLNTQPLDKAAAASTWTDGALSEMFVTDIYNGIQEGTLQQNSLDNQTDNCLFNFGRQDIMESAISPSNTGGVLGTMEWGNMYSRIRAANLALENLATAPFDADMVARLKGETYFLRAYYYNQLLRYYGAIPLIKSSYVLSSPDFTIPRNTYEECVNSIVSDVDSAALLLDGKSLALGRATKAAAMALKSRVLTYAASDLHDMPTAKAKSAVINGFSNPELLGYVSGDQNARWLAAKAASKAVLDLGGIGYNLNLTAPQSKESAITDYQNVFLGKGGGEKDAIFAKWYINAATDDWGAWYPRNNMPNGYHGWSSTEPTQKFVDSYEMMDGSKFDWNNPAEAAAPYENRDPRFYASVFYDGAAWKPRTTDGAAIDPFGELQFGTYQTGTGGGTTSPYFGLDTRNSSIENWNGTRTGYVIRKMMDPNPAIVDMNQKSELPTILIRYTEVVFNYVEACLETGDEATAKEWLNKIRFRAGMPAITASGSALVDAYRNERNIEMFAEDQRFFDARRWMIAPEHFGQKVKIMVITGTLKPGKTVTTYRYSKDNYNYNYHIQEIEQGVENRSWNDKVYFPPIKLDEMNKNSKLIQNPGYN